MFKLRHVMKEYEIRAVHELLNNNEIKYSFNKVFMK